jgi:hypothetical protein
MGSAGASESWQNYKKSVASAFEKFRNESAEVIA